LLECLKQNNNVTKLKTVQRLINVKITQAFCTTWYEAFSVLTEITPILIEVGKVAKCYHITRGKNQEGLYVTPKDYRKWSHLAEAIEIKEKCDRKEYKI
jgi:hypothetical protein